MAPNTFSGACKSIFCFAHVIVRCFHFFKSKSHRLPNKYLESSWVPLLWKLCLRPDASRINTRQTDVRCILGFFIDGATTCCWGFWCSSVPLLQRRNIFQRINDEAKMPCKKYYIGQAWTCIFFVWTLDLQVRLVGVESVEVDHFFCWSCFMARGRSQRHRDNR